jgi:heme exporter protein D
MSIRELVSQGGYGSFVWGAYAMGIVLMIAEVIQLRRQRRTILARIGRLIRMRAQETDNESQT